MRTLEKKEGVLSKYRVFETDQFLSDLEHVGSNIRKKIYFKIQNYAYPQLRANPLYGKNIKKLIDYDPPTWRYRIGDYRLFYEIDEHENILYIITIAIRQKAY